MNYMIYRPIKKMGVLIRNEEREARYDRMMQEAKIEMAIQKWQGYGYGTEQKKTKYARI